jgi:hypothetical protein
MLFDVLLDVDNSDFRQADLLLEDAPNLLSLNEPEKGLFDGLGGGIRARAEICL